GALGPRDEARGAPHRTEGAYGGVDSANEDFPGTFEFCGVAAHGMFRQGRRARRDARIVPVWREAGQRGRRRSRAALQPASGDWPGYARRLRSSFFSTLPLLFFGSASTKK